MRTNNLLCVPCNIKCLYYMETNNLSYYMETNNLSYYMETNNLSYSFLSYSNCDNL